MLDDFGRPQAVCRLAAGIGGLLIARLAESRYKRGPEGNRHDVASRRHCRSRVEFRVHRRGDGTRHLLGPTDAARLHAACATHAGRAAGGAAGRGTPCAADFVPLRQEAEKRAGALRVAAARKAQRNEICNLITRFSEAEGKFAKYVEANQTWCGIPSQIVAQIKANHAKTMQTRTNRSAATAAMGAQGPAIPPGPGLSDALGTNRAPSAANTTTGKGGTFDTLSGNPIK